MGDWGPKPKPSYVPGPDYVGLPNNSNAYTVSLNLRTFCLLHKIMLCDVLCVSPSYRVSVSCLFRYRERIVIEPHPEPKKYENFELSGKIYCRRCHWNWGVMGVYKKVPFPIINIERFVVVSPYETRDKYKRWKEVPFHVEPICPDDLQIMRPAEDEDDDSDLWQQNA